MEFKLRVEKFFKTHKILIFIVIFAFCLRGFYAIYMYEKNVTPDIFDSATYYSFAQSIISQGPLVLNSDYDRLTSIVGPGLPWFLSVILLLGGDWLTIVIINCFLNTVLCVIIYLIAKNLFDEKVALFTAFWSSIYIQYIYSIPTAGKEIWISLLMVLIILSIIHLEKSIKKNYKIIIFLAFIFTYLSHIDERYVAYLPLITIILFFISKFKLALKIKRVILFLVVVFILMLPWFIRNYLVFQNIVILTVRTTTITNKILGYDKKIFYNHYGNRELTRVQMDSVAKGLKTHFSSTDKIRPGQIEEMKKGKYPHRFSIIENIFDRMIDLWRPIKLTGDYYKGGFSYIGPWSLRHNLSFMLTYGILLPFLPIGIVYLYKRKKKVALILCSILFYHTLIHVLFIPYTRDRYRIAIDSIIIIIGIAGAIITYNYFKSKYILNHGNLD